MNDNHNDNHDVGREENVFYFREGWKQKIGNITKIYVKGDDYERGIQFGKLLSKEIKQVFATYLSFLINTNKNIPLFAKWLLCRIQFLIKPFLFLFYRKKLKMQMSKYPAWLIRELEGMAKGAGMAPFYLKFMNLISDEPNESNDGNVKEKEQSCFSFAFHGEDGNIYHGKNLDWVVVEKFIDLIYFQQHEDENGDSFFIIGVPGYLVGLEFGMNSHGISIGLTGRFYRGKRASKIVSTDVIETEILRYGKNFEDIKKIYNIKAGFDRNDALLISSKADQDFKLFEVAPIGVTVTNATNGILFNTNTYIHPLFQKYNKQWGTVYNGNFCDPRYKRLKTLMSQNPRTMEDAFRILRDMVQPGVEDRTFLGQATLNRFVSQVSALMIQGEHPGVWIARDRAYAASNEYVFFDFSSRPQQLTKVRAADAIIYSEKFKNFKDFMHLREKRYFISSRKLLKDAEKILKREPDNPVFILYLAQNYFKYGHFKKSLSVLETHPIEWMADYWYCMGKCNQHLLLHDEATNCFEKAMKLPSIDGFSELVETVCMVQLVNIYRSMGRESDAQLWKEKLEAMKSKFATPHIGMPDYPYINNISEQLEQVEL
ncbi:MAG: C45 family autoproteolytic acyltransferase/hydrolase [Candidatus Omnitrophota bacterium]